MIYATCSNEIGLIAEMYIPVHLLRHNISVISSVAT